MSEAYRIAFCKIFWECLKSGMTTVESRYYASLELGPPIKAKEIKLNEQEIYSNG